MISTIAVLYDFNEIILTVADQRVDVGSILAGKYHYAWRVTC